MLRDFAFCYSSLQQSWKRSYEYYLWNKWQGDGGPVANNKHSKNRSQPFLFWLSVVSEESMRGSMSMGGLRASLQHSVTRQFPSTRQSSLLCSKVLSDLLSRVLILMKGCTKNLHDLWSTLSGGTSASTPSKLAPQLIKRKSGLLRDQTAQLCGFISQETKTNRYVKRSLCWRTPLSRWKIVNPWLTCYPEFSRMRPWTPLPGSSHLNAELLTERRLSR